MFTRRQKVSIARALLLVMLLQTFQGYFGSARAETPVASQLQDMVNPFTGDLGYSLPLLTVPGPNGENVPVAVSYGSGIRMEQEASWAGLGWDYNPGEISRQVNGAPDDWKNELLERDKYNGSAAAGDDTRIYGPLYYKDFPDNPGTLDAMDFYQSDRLMKGSSFEAPDYDSYYVSGPGISGEMQPFLFEFASLRGKSIPKSGQMDTDADDDGAKFVNGYSDFTGADLRFLFKGELAAKKTAPLVLVSSAGRNDGYAPSWFVDPSEYDYTNTRYAYAGTLRAGNYVEFFRNASLTGSLPSGFLESGCVGAPGRSSLPADGIGAFRITAPDGMTYHYSLPVYNYSEKQTRFSLDESFNISADTMVKDIKAGKYAVSWKLTAVTGPDYSDANNDNRANEGDTGYWIAYNYGYWASDFRWSYPYFGFTTDEIGSIVPGPYKKKSPYRLTYKRMGSVAAGSSEICYLNSIKTATHAAYFVKEVRRDAFGKKTGSSYYPKLRISKIILMRSGDAQGFLEPDDSDGLSLNGLPAITTRKGNVLHTGNYNAHKAAVDAASLKTIEFGYDYSLCPRLYNNIANSFTTSQVSQSGREAFELITGSTFGADGGKLTLKSITQRETGYVKVYPDYLFAYAKNRDYNHDQVDFWGYYKSDYSSSSRGGYTTGASKNHLDAWSLTRITTPVGSEINIVYEADTYDRVGYKGSESFLSFPQRIFALKTASASKVFTVYDTDAITFLNEGVSAGRVVVPAANTAGCQTSTACEEQARNFGIEYVRSEYQPNYTFGDFVGEWSLSGQNISVSVNFKRPLCYSSNPTCPDPLGYYNSASSLGYLQLQPLQAYGGGIRVKEISVKETSTGEEYKSRYTYTEGIATTEPDRFGLPDGITVHASAFAGDRHLIPPMVGYTSVRVQEDAGGLSNGSATYTFNNYEEDFIPTVTKEAKFPGVVSGFHEAHLYLAIRVDQGKAFYGKPESITYRDKNGNVVFSRRFQYENSLSDETGGRLEEKFHRRLTWTEEVKVGSQTQHYKYFLSSICTRVYHTTWLKREITGKDGITITKEYSNPDPLSGIMSGVKVTDPTRGLTESSTVFAYSDKPSMGSRFENTAYRHQLSQVREVRVRQGGMDRDAYNNVIPVNPALTGGSQVSWSNNHRYRRFDPALNRYKSEVSSETAPAGYWAPENTSVFNGASGSVITWKPESRVTLYDPKNKKVLETRGIKRYSATKYGYGNKFPVASVRNASYNSFAFSSFEEFTQEDTSPLLYFYGGEVYGGERRMEAAPPDLGGTQLPNVIAAHSGSYVAKVPAGQFGPGFTTLLQDETTSEGVLSHGFQKGRTYRASVWVHSSSPPQAALVAHLTGSKSSGVVNDLVLVQKDNPANIAAGSWVQMNLDITVPADYTAAGGIFNDLRFYILNNGASDAWYDDLSIHPVDAEITGYVYDERTGWVKAVLDNDNFATHYTHDAAGRVISTYRETRSGIRKLTETQYHFAR